MKNKTFIIAEIGKNFIQTKDGQSLKVYLENAKHLVDAAVESGADAVKFQTHTVEDEQMDMSIVSPHFNGVERYAWVLRNTNCTPLAEFWMPLSKYCREKGIIFFSTPMSRGAAKILEKLDVMLWKIGSGDVLDFVLLDFVRRTNKQIIISTGMSTEAEIDKAIAFILEENKNLVLLHCVSKYPCPPEDLNLGTIRYLKGKYNIPVGFSDHSIGIESDLLAVALGATVVEKHFSWSRDLWGADHKVSMTPDEFKQMVFGIRNLENDINKKSVLLQTQYARKATKFTKKILQEGESVFRPVFRKSLVAGCNLKAGTKILPEMVYAMRPQMYLDGLPSEEYNTVVGKKLKIDLLKYQSFKLDFLE